MAVLSPECSDQDMSQDARLRPEPSTAISSWNDRAESQRPIPLAPRPQRNLTDVARTLAAHGGGAIAFQLALDLVLNEVVDQARSATGATGAAVALARDGVMECRATTGESAPDLGTRVDSDSGLTGACLRTGEIQNCADTEADPRVDAETCRQLGVRSMLIIPLSDGTGPFGILEVFWSQPNAFHERSVEALKVLAKRIVASTREAEQGGNSLIASVEEEPDLPVLVREPDADQEQDAKGNRPRNDEHREASARETAEEPAKTGDFLTTALVVLVVAVAVVLGVVIGWRGAARRSIANSLARIKTTPAASTVVQHQGPVEPPARGSSASTAVERVSSPPQLKKAVPSALIKPPAGGLVVTQNGKVIYQAFPSGEPGIGSAGGTSQVSARLVHRVEPEYPADAKSRSIQGAVVLDVQVLTDGTVGTIGIVSGEPLLAQAAVHAVRQWRYQPEFVNGRSVEAQTRVTVNFTLPPAD
jgi:TonB family protein